MKTFKEIEAFVRKAMDENLCVHTSSFANRVNITIVGYNTNILIYLTDFKYLRLLCKEGEDIYSESKLLELNEREEELFKLLRMDVEDYENSRIIKVFDNFFKEDDSKKTVDDLDDDE